MQTNANVMPGAAPAMRTRDPRALLFSVAIIVVASMATVRTVGGMLALLVFVAAWHLLATGRHSVLPAVRRILPFALLILVLNAALVPGDPLLVIGGRGVLTAQGLHDGVFFALRLGVMLMAVSLLITAASAESIAHGIHDLVRRVSRRLADRIAFFTFLSTGFVPLLMDEIQRVRVAQAFRSGGVERTFASRAASVRTWLVPVLMSAIRRSGQLALAVELRDIRARLIPSMPPLRARPVDIAWLVSALAVVVLASWSR